MCPLRPFTAEVDGEAVQLDEDDQATVQLPRMLPARFTVTLTDAGGVVMMTLTVVAPQLPA